MQDISDTNSESDKNESTDVMDPNDLESINKRKPYFDTKMMKL